jgi:hypothetical protein
MKLSVLDRVVFSSLYPETSDKITMMVLSEIDEKVAFTPEERKELKMRFVGPEEGGPGFVWDDKKEFEKEINFSDSELSVIRSSIETLNTQKKIRLNQIKTIKKFS